MMHVTHFIKLYQHWKYFIKKYLLANWWGWRSVLLLFLVIWHWTYSKGPFRLQKTKHTQSAARVILYVPSHRQDSTYNSLCYTSCGALPGKRNSSMGPPRRKERKVICNNGYTASDGSTKDRSNNPLQDE